ncbi:MAG: PIN domain-containing protein [Alphaproteobacteria bacterium]
MPKTILLVDYENVRDVALTQLPEGHKRVLLFIGKQQLEAREQKPDPSFIKGILAKGARLDLIPIAEQGGNNLDLHLAFYLGKILAEEPQAHYIIFTKDKTDFGPLIAHLKNRGVSCERQQPPVKAAPPAKTSQQKIKKPATAPLAKVKAVAPPVKLPVPQKPAAPKAARPKKAAAPQPETSPHASAAKFLKTAGKRQPKKREGLINSLMSHLQKDKAAIERLIDDLIEARVIEISRADKVTYFS